MNLGPYGCIAFSTYLMYGAQKKGYGFSKVTIECRDSQHRGPLREPRVYGSFHKSCQVGEHQCRPSKYYNRDPHKGTAQRWETPIYWDRKEVSGSSLPDDMLDKYVVRGPQRFKELCGANFENHPNVGTGVGAWENLTLILHNSRFRT